MAKQTTGVVVGEPVILDELRLRRFARLASGLLRGSAAEGVGPRAAHNRAGPGLEYLDTRAYAPGDDLRHVDWRQTSRYGRPMIRRYRDESASDWYLCVDGSASMGMGDKWGMARELASALAYALIFAGHRVALEIFAERAIAFCTAGRGQHQFASILRHLCDHQPAKRGGASMPGLCAEMISRSGNLVLISDFLRDDAMVDDLRLLRGSVSSARALQVLGADETDARGTGPSQLFDVESNKERRVILSAATREVAGERLRSHNDAVRRHLASMGMPFSTCTAGDDWERVLLAHLGA